MKEELFKLMAITEKTSKWNQTCKKVQCRRQFPDLKLKLQEKEAKSLA